MAQGRGLTGPKKTQFLDETARATTARVTSGSKPHIDEVGAAFHAFRTETSRIMRLYKPMSVEMVRAFDQAKDKLKAELARMGLADRIDWK